MSLEALKNTRPLHLDRLGILCLQGQDVATYLFQVPDDETQWTKMRVIVEEILKETAGSQRRELPRLVNELKEAVDGSHDMMTADQLQSGFDRLVKLWKSARSGIF